MVNIKSKGCRFDLNTTQKNKYKSFELFIWVKPTNGVKTTKQQIRVYIINSRKQASLNIWKKVRTSNTGYWLKIESRRITKLLNQLIMSSRYQNIKIGLLANTKIFQVTTNGESTLNVS